MIAPTDQQSHASTHVELRRRTSVGAGFSSTFQLWVVVAGLAACANLGVAVCAELGVAAPIEITAKLPKAITNATDTAEAAFRSL